MAYEPILRRSGVGGTAAVPMASAEAFGGGLGRVVEEIDQLHERRKQRAELADVGARSVQLRLDADQASVDAQNTAGPGAEGHAKAMSDWFDQRRTAFLESIRSKDVRERAAAQLDEFGARFKSREYQFQEVKRVGKQITDVRAIGDLGSNRILHSADPDVAAVYGEEMRIGRETIMAMVGTSDEIKQGLIRETEQQYTVGYVQNVRARDPKLAKAMIDAGTFDAILTPAQVDQLQNGNDVEIRRVEATAEHQVNLQAKEDNDTLASIGTDLAAGISVDPARLDGILARAVARGDESVASTARVRRVQAAIKPATDVMSPQQIETRINELAGLKNPSPEQEIELQAYRQARSTVIDRYTNRPGEWAANNDRPPPSLNLADRASVQDYKAWRAGVIGETGKDPGLPPAQIAEWREMAKGAAGQRADLATLLQSLPIELRRVAAREIDPNDTLLENVVALSSPMARSLALEGPAALKANPALVTPIDARDTFNSYIGGALDALPAETRAQIQQTATYMYAGLAQRGHIDEFDKRQFHKMIDASMQNSITRWRGAAIAIPLDLRDGGFELRLSRWDGKIPPGAANGRPMTGAGADISVGFIKSNLLPRMVSDGRYEFLDASGRAVRNAKGEDWVLNVRALPTGGPAAAKSGAAQRAEPAIGDLPRPKGQQAVWGAPPR